MSPSGGAARRKSRGKIVLGVASKPERSLTRPIVNTTPAELLMRNFNEIFIGLYPIRGAPLFPGPFTEDCLWIHPAAVVGLDGNEALLRFADISLNTGTRSRLRSRPCTRSRPAGGEVVCLASHSTTQERTCSKSSMDACHGSTCSVSCRRKTVPCNARTTIVFERPSWIRFSWINHGVSRSVPAVRQPFRQAGGSICSARNVVNCRNIRRLTYASWPTGSREELCYMQASTQECYFSPMAGKDPYECRRRSVSGEVS
jgi:hypothetical protein